MPGQATPAAPKMTLLHTVDLPYEASRLVAVFWRFLSAARFVEQGSGTLVHHETRQVVTYRTSIGGITLVFADAGEPPHRNAGWGILHVQPLLDTGCRVRVARLTADERYGEKLRELWDQFVGVAGFECYRGGTL